KEQCEVIYLPRTEDISTTEIKKMLASLNKSELENMESSLHSVIEIAKTMSNK
ncbi:glycerol-3-phosphate cytidylyltransferase, partial [Salinivibrio sp. IB643]